MSVHEDGGGGFCDCGAERCSLPECDGWCRHVDGWIEPEEIAARRQQAVRVQLASGTQITLSRELLQDLGLG